MQRIRQQQGTLAFLAFSSALCNYFHLDSIPGQVIFIACKEEVPSGYLGKASQRHVYKGIDLLIIRKCVAGGCDGILGPCRIRREGPVPGEQWAEGLEGRLEPGAGLHALRSPTVF